MTHSIDVTRGSTNSVVSAQWAFRPDDQRFLDLATLEAQCEKWRAESYTVDMAPAEIEAKYDPEVPSYLRLQVKDALVEPTHYGFGQIATLADAPAKYLRSLPGPLAALNINYGLRAAKQSEVQAYMRKNGSVNLRGVTSPRYGRIFDVDVVKEIRKLAGNGTGDTDWKVPGCIEWGNAHGVSYNPHVDITKENTTLYASDRDLFIFLVDDTHPIEIGKLANGEPDLVFRGFYCWNSEVGARTFGVATFYLRGVCQNRNLWGVEGFSEITFKHSVTAPEKFIAEAGPALLSYAQGDTSKVVLGVKAAKAAIVSTTDEERVDFLTKYGFSVKQAEAIMRTALEEEGHAAESVWDHAQGITAVARHAEHQDRRLQMELTAGKMLDKVTA